MGPESLPRQEVLSTGPALVFASTISILVGFLFGLFPLLKYAGPNLVNALKEGGRASSDSRERHRARNGLVVSQIALALVLLIASGLMIRSFQALRHLQPGFVRPEEVLTLRLSIPETEIEDVEQAVRGFCYRMKAGGNKPGASPREFRKSELIMRMPGIVRVTVLCLSCSFSGAVLAQEQQPPEDKAGAQISPQQFVTHHKIQIGEDVLSYTAIAGQTIVPDDEGGQKAGIFSISYIKEGVDSQEARPITFLFNGGPGSSAVWLHLGAFGPRRIAFPSDPENPGAPPYGFGDNPYTLLRFTDLVFVDPVGTGYSHALGKTKDRDYWGVDEDSRILAEFIRSFLTANNRWNSAKYLIGESYGTLRASVMIRDLELNPLDGVFVNGVVLLSSANDVRTFITADESNELPYVTNLPTYAATAFYHHALPEQPTDRDDFIRQVEAFAGTEYLQALFRGNSLPSDQEQEIAEKLHRFTGLGVEYLKRCHLRVDRNRFLKELLRSRGQTIAMHDTRFLGKDHDEAGETVELDPFLFGMAGPFVATMNEYLISDLDVKMDEPYKIFSMEANQAWKRAGSGRHAFSGYLNTTPYLAAAAATNKDFRVFVVNGLHDLTTTFYGTRYVFEHSGIPRERLTLKNYEGGHMMYLIDASLQELSEDIGAFMGGK